METNKLKVLFCYLINNVGIMKSRVMLFLMIVTFIPASLLAQFFAPADFVEDGIAYQILGDGESVGVHAKTTWPGMSVNYNIDVIDIPSHVFSTQFNKEYIVKKINEQAFFSSPEHVKYITIPETIESIEDLAFANTAVEMHNYTDMVGHQWYGYESTVDNMFFYNAKQCTIGANAFSHDYTLSFDNSSIVGSIIYCYFRVGNEVEQLPTGLPYYDMTDETLYIPDNVQVLKEKSLNGKCGTLVVGKGVTSISNNAFENNVHLPKVYCTKETPPNVPSYYHLPIDTLYVPVGKAVAYQRANGWKYATTIIEKEYITVQSLDLGYNEISIYKGESLRFNPTPYPLNSTAFEERGNGITKMVARSVENPDHLIHLTNETFEATEEGEYDITAYVDTVVAKCHVIVLPEYQGNVQCVRIQHEGADLESKVIKEGESLNLEALIYPANSADVAQYQVVDWTSSDNVIASVSDSGTVLGLAEGECDITVTIRNSNTGNELSDMCHIVVDKTDAIDHITVEPLENSFVDVYTMQGQLLRHRAPLETATQGLAPGIYIVGHKKVMVR